MSIKTAQNEFNDFNESFSYRKQLAKKDKQIIMLQNKINNLIFNKNSLINQIDKSIIQKNITSLKSISPKSNSNSIKHNFYPSFQPLQDHNSMFKKKLNLSDKIGDKYSNTFQYKLLSAQTEIENLTIMNTSKDKIIMTMQNFINNINNAVCDGKINLNLNIIDIPTFIINLKKLEQKVMKKLNKIPKSFKISESLIKKIKDNSIKKQKTEVISGTKNKLYIIPFNQISKIYNQSSINESKYSNNSFQKQNFVCQNYIKKKIKEPKNIKYSSRRNKSIHKNINIKDNTLKIKKFLLSKKEEKYITIPVKKHMKSLDNKYYKEYLNTINNEMSYSRILNDNGNNKSILNKKFIDK